MSNTAQLIDLIVQGKNAEASDLLNNELLTRSYAEIAAIKPEVAAKYFAPIIGEPEETEPDDENDEENLLQGDGE